MKHLVAIFLLLQSTIAYSQDLSIRVMNMNSQPMPFAYILINDKPVSVCDSMGIAIVPINRIKINDTIRVSYLGSMPAWILFDESMKNSKSYCFHLDESGYRLNEIVVSYNDSEKLFRKSVNLFSPLNFDCKMQAKISANVYRKDNLSYKGSGIIESINDSKVSHYWPWFDPPVKYITDSDTIGEWKALDKQIHLALNLSNLSLRKCQKSKKLKVYYTYLGVQDNYKVFRIVYPKTYLKDWNYQIILNIDKNTKNIKSVRVEALKDNPAGNFERLTISYDCEVYADKTQKKRIIYLPDNIKYNYRRSGNEQFDLSISEISLTI